MRPKVEIENERKSIMAVLEEFPDGVRLGGILAKLDFAINRDSLRYRLKGLQTDGLVEVSGRRGGTRYKSAADAGKHEGGPAIPLSEGSRELLELVRRPLHARKPVGYQREFLEDYQPNETPYLSESERGRLWDVGRSRDTGKIAGTQARKILDRLLVDLSWNSSRLEGNTYSQLDTKHLVERGKAAEGKPTEDTQMILNHKRAVEFLVDSAGDIGFDRRTVLSLHSILAENLLSNPDGEGQLRSGIVEIGGSVYNPSHIPQQIAECLDLILEKANAIEDPFEQSLFAMVQLPYLQPFIDVNKRVSRFAANIPLIQRNLPPLSFVGVGKDMYVQALLGVYELNSVDMIKEVFIWAYGRSANRYLPIRKDVGEPDPFRLRYRESIHAILADVVVNARGKPEAARLVEEEAGRLPDAEREQFIETVEAEILALHEGNFARYRIRPSEFREWQKVWDAG